MTVERILDNISNWNCSRDLELKLAPLSNKLISGQIMEVSSMAIELAQLTRADTSEVTCVRLDEEPAAGPSGRPSLRLRLTIEQQMRDQRVASRWRLYPRLLRDEMPVERAFGLAASQRNQPGQWRAGDRCQRFRVETGHFHLFLLSFTPRLTFDARLVKLGERSYSASAEHGGSIRLVDYHVHELFLDQSLRLSRPAPGAASPSTVQILHDHNKHYRRNNWLLEAYANWLKHEYRHQLAALLGGSLANQLNSSPSCLAN